MLQDIYARFRGGCMMLLRKEGDAVLFLGTAFLVHPDGYLLTAGHSVQGRDNVMVAPRDFGSEFAPMWSETVAPYQATVCQVDAGHDLALLKFQRDFEIVFPDHMMGVPETVSPGSSVALLGYPFGFQHVFNQFIEQSVVSTKLVTNAGTNLLLFDGVVNLGMRGAPLVTMADGRVIGVVNGRFDPAQAGDSETEPAEQPHFSFAVSIEYAAAMLEAEGLEII